MAKLGIAQTALTLIFALILIVQSAGNAFRRTGNNQQKSLLPSGSRASTPDFEKRSYYAGDARLDSTFLDPDIIFPGGEPDRPSHPQSMRSEARVRGRQSYVHVWASSDGKTHIARCSFTNYTSIPFAPPAAPEWVNKAVDQKPKKINYVVQPVGWTGSWHRNPAPQWVVPISGSWYVNTTDGDSIVLGPGEISFGEDQRAFPEKEGGRVGHFSGTTGPIPNSNMVVQLDWEPTVDRPCHWK